MAAKIKLFAVAVFLSAAFACCAPAFSAELMIADFENNGRTNLGTDIGTWSSNPYDTSQGTTIEMIPLYGVMGRATTETIVMKVTYDVAANGPAFNGVYIKLNNTDLSPYDEMSMLIKGDPGKGFSTKFKVELKNARGERAVYVLNGITGDWQEMKIPMQALKSLGSVTDWKNMVEIVFTFDDMTVDSKEGTYFIDEIKFSTAEQPK